MPSVVSSDLIPARAMAISNSSTTMHSSVRVKCSPGVDVEETRIDSTRSMNVNGRVHRIDDECSTIMPNESG